MTVDVNYGAGRVIYDVLASEAFTSPVSGQVQLRGDDVYQYLLDLEANAEFTAQEALTSIEELRSFNAGVGTVSFSAPDAPDPQLLEMPDLLDLDLVHPELSRSDLDVDFDYDLEDAVNQSWTSPPSIDYTQPARPPQLPAEALPGAPSAYTLPTLTVPDFSVPEFSGGAVDPPSLEEISLDIGELQPIEEFSVTVETAGLAAEIERMRDFNPIPPSLPSYSYLIPEIFTVVGSMAAGDPIVDYLSLLEKRSGLLSSTDASTAVLFDRRGLYMPPAAPEYDAWLDSIRKDKADDSDTVFVEVAKDEVVRTAFELGTAAHRLLVDIETALYDLEFTAAKAAANARLEVAKSVVAVYQAEVTLLNTRIAEYNAQLASVQGKAKAFLAQAEQAQIIGRSNALQAELFSVEEGLKAVDANVYSAQVAAEAVKLRRYAALIDSSKSVVAQAESAVAAYAGDVARYRAEVERISVEYDAYAADAQATQFDNAARVASLQATQSELQAYAIGTGAVASEAAARSIQLQARSAVDETHYIKRALQADEDGVAYGIDVGEYAELITEYADDLTKRIPRLAGKQDVASTISRYVQVAQESIGRAANLSQAANVQLAQAYRTVYEAAGRAGASVASGKLSGFRASATMAAGENLSASNSYGVSVEYNGQNRYSESDNYYL